MSTSGASESGPVETGGAAPRGKPSSELRSAELVSRLLAATPPYLYNMPLIPQSYFFSEMLRSLVKNNNEANRLQAQNAAQIPGHRRSRKRLWNQTKLPTTEPLKNPDMSWHGRQLEEMDSNQNLHHHEKPLELTTHKQNRPKFNAASFLTENKGNEGEREAKIRRSPKSDDKFSTGVLASGTPGLALPPPPPPLWYPPLYTPPYGMDPLNFFIDLRVSGHIYDRKHKEEAPAEVQPNIPSDNTFTLNNNNFAQFKENIKGGRHTSAFSVPKPRDPSKQFPLSLYSQSRFKYFDDSDVEQKVENKSASTHYVMQNLKRIYGDLEMRGEKPRYGDLDPGTGNDSDCSDSDKKRPEDLSYGNDYDSDRKIAVDSESSNDVELLEEQNN